jgi:serine O-acetyltransferase
MTNKKSNLSKIAEDMMGITITRKNIDNKPIIELAEWMKKTILYAYKETEELTKDLYLIEKRIKELFEIYPGKMNKPEQETEEILNQLPKIKEFVQKDINKTYKGDPAAKNFDEIVATYPGIFATVIYRIAHEFYQSNHPIIARIMTEYVHKKTGIDIHPGAKIGHSFFIDHGTGVVIGETCEIGNNVTLYHGVTLGVKTFELDEGGEIKRGVKRHPTIEDDVIIYAEAMVLGGDTRVGKGSIIGSGVSVTKSVEPYSKVTKKNEASN